MKISEYMRDRKSPKWLKEMNIWHIGIPFYDYICLLTTRTKYLTRMLIHN